MVGGLVELEQFELVFQERERQHLFEIFGADRMAELEGNEASPESTTAFAWAVEEICSGPEGRPVHGALIHSQYKSPDHRLNMSWNPAGIKTDLLGSYNDWDEAQASVDNLMTQRRWLLRPGGPVRPGRYEISEGMYINTDGKAMVRRRYTPLFDNDLWRYTPFVGDDFKIADKPATEDEVMEAIQFLAEYKERLSDGETTERPLYLEIAYGLDPMAERGKRKFKNKICVEVDSAEGNYETVRGDYSTAVDDLTAAILQDTVETDEENRVVYVKGKAENLPLPDKSVRETFASNLLNAPLDIEAKIAILDELMRVADSNAYLVVRVNWRQDEWPEHITEELLINRGFSVVKTVRNQDTAYEQLEHQYGTPQEIEAPPGYYVVATAPYKKQ